MQKEPTSKSPPWITWLLVGLGLLGLAMLVHRTDFAQVSLSFSKLGALGILLVALAFLPHFFFTTASWWVALSPRPEKGFRTRSFLLLHAINYVVFSWNNLGPVTKSMGEAGRVYLLSKAQNTRDALRSVLVLNLSLILGGLLAFAGGALVALEFFSFAPQLRIVCWIIALLLPAAVTIALVGIGSGKSRRLPSRGIRFRRLRHWWKWSTHNIRKLQKLNPTSLALSIFFATLARLSEATVFYVTFSLLGQPLTVAEAITLEIGRGIADNIFFFMPYQLGTREAALLFVAHNILHINGSAALAAALAFRIGEIIWILLGLAPAPLLARVPQLSLAISDTPEA